MSDMYRQSHAIPVTQAEAAIDPGLRKFMLGVYNKMGLGLILSAVLAYGVGAWAPLTQAVFGTPLLYVVQFGPLVLILASSFIMRNPSPTGSAIIYWSIVTLMGMGLGIWVYIAMARIGVTTRGGQEMLVTFGTMAKAFLITAAGFGGLSLWGYTTKRNLSGLHSMVIMAAWGLALVAGVGYFLHSSMLEVGLEIAALGIYSVLIATQTNQLREFFFVNRDNTRSLAVMTNYGALNLYIAFVTVFQMLLSLMSSRR
jgi:uncharacterized protein